MHPPEVSVPRLEGGFSPHLFTVLLFRHRKRRVNHGYSPHIVNQPLSLFRRRRVGLLYLYLHVDTHLDGHYRAVIHHWRLLFYRRRERRRQW